MKTQPCTQLTVLQALVVQTLDSAIHRINHYTVDKYQGKRLSYPLGSDLSGGQGYPTFKQLGPVVQTLDSAIHWINHYPADSVIDFRNTYQLDSDLSGGQRYPTFEQPGPGARQIYCKWKVQM